MKAQATKTFRLKLERTIRASRERVWDAWTEPEQLKKWSAPEGLEVADGETDLRVGGRWRVVMRNPETEETYIAVGEYREITPPERLVYTHSWETDEEPVETLLTVELEETGEGSTRVVMVQEGFQREEVRDGHEEGWSSCLNRLERLFA